MNNDPTSYVVASDLIYITELEEKAQEVLKTEEQGSG